MKKRVRLVAVLLLFSLLLTSTSMILLSCTQSQSAAMSSSAEEGVSGTEKLTLSETSPAETGSPEKRNESREYTVNEPYVYKVAPGMDEWKLLDTMEKKYAALEIPEYLLESMTTEALFQTVLNYPLLQNIMSNTKQLETAKDLADHFNGLKEFAQRDGAMDLVEKELSQRIADSDAIGVSELNGIKMLVQHYRNLE